MKLDISKLIYIKLLREIKEGKYSDCEKLPRELELAEQFGISRNHLREVLAQLENEGFITRLHGIGTMINHHVVKVKNRIDIDAELLDTIRHNGYQPGVSHIKIQEEKADKDTAEKLHIMEKDEIMRVCRVYTANERPVVYCEDILKKSLIKEKYELEDFKESMYDFLKNCCHVSTYMDLTQVQAILADEKLSGLLEVVEGSPLLYMEEADYDVEGNVVLISSQYVLDDYLEYTVLRKKL